MPPGTATEQFCIGGLLYNEETHACDWPQNVAGCQKHREWSILLYPNIAPCQPPSSRPLDARVLCSVRKHAQEGLITMFL